MCYVVDCILQSLMKYYSDELQLNHQFRQFIVNASLLYGGYNTVSAQLQINKTWAENKRLYQWFVLIISFQSCYIFVIRLS